MNVHVIKIPASLRLKNDTEIKPKQEYLEYLVKLAIIPQLTEPLEIELNHGLIVQRFKIDPANVDKLTEPQIKPELKAGLATLQNYIVRKFDNEKQNLDIEQSKRIIENITLLQTDKLTAPKLLIPKVDLDNHKVVTETKLPNTFEKQTEFFKAKIENKLQSKGSGESGNSKSIRGLDKEFYNWNDRFTTFLRIMAGRMNLRLHELFIFTPPKDDFMHLDDIRSDEDKMEKYNQLTAYLETFVLTAFATVHQQIIFWTDSQLGMPHVIFDFELNHFLPVSVALYAAEYLRDSLPTRINPNLDVPPIIHMRMAANTISARNDKGASKVLAGTRVKTNLELVLRTKQTNRKKTAIVPLAF